MFRNISKDNPVVAWFSGGADSAITCWLCIKWFGEECVRVIMIDTKNEDEDTYRFKEDCERWWGVKIEMISSSKWDSIEDVWEHHQSLNTAKGAVCSTELKRLVRQGFQMRQAYSYQAFGFDADELGRARQMRKNYPDSRPIFPLIYSLMSKGESIRVLQKEGIEPPNAYKMGYSNNNCLKTGCVQGGIGYWQKFAVDFPDRFDRMAQREHDLTEAKGQPVTVCKDQSKAARAINNGKDMLVFLKPHPDYPHMKDISMIKGRMAEPLMECNGFCGIKGPLK